MPIELQGKPLRVLQEGTYEHSRASLTPPQPAAVTCGVAGIG